MLKILVGFRTHYAPIWDMDDRTRIRHLLALPLATALVGVNIWYFIFYRYRLQYSDGMVEFADTAYMAGIGLLYALLAAEVIHNAFDKYQRIRLAIKEYDIDTFMNLCDEDTSPIFHTVMTVLACFILLAFMQQPYTSPRIGAFIIGSTTYMFSLIYCVIREIDDPFRGIWVIKSIHEEWLQIDPKKWRDKRHEELSSNQDLKEAMKKCRRESSA